MRRQSLLGSWLVDFHHPSSGTQRERVDEKIVLDGRAAVFAAELLDGIRHEPAPVAGRGVESQGFSKPVEPSLVGQRLDRPAQQRLGQAHEA